MDTHWVFLDIDTQVDFMLPHGALYVPGAEQIIPNLRALMGYAQEHQIPVLSSADAHLPDDPSFAQWPPHCVVGTAGQRRIPETQLSPSLVIPNRAGAFTPPLQPVAQVIVEKVDYDISSNPNFDAVLSALAPQRFVAFGVATEYCVQASALALLRRGFPVDLVKDAIRGITEEGSRKALDALHTAGARSVQTADVVAGSFLTHRI
jgi:nicotinamidase/pyrazinamidase